MGKTPITDRILVELGWRLEGNKWIHFKGAFIYSNKLPKTLVELVDIMTGTAYKIGNNNCKEHDI